MADANLVAYNAALKDTWTEDRLAEQLHQGDHVLSLLETTRRFRVGNEARTPLHTSRNAGFTMLGPGGGTLNAAGFQGSKRAVWKYRNAHHQIAIEGETIDGTANDAVAVAEVLDTEVTGALSDIRRQLCRQIYNDQSAVIAKCATTTGSTTLNLEPVSGFNAIERGWLFEGAVIDIGTAANPTSVGTRTVVSVVESETNPQVVVNTAVTAASTDSISYKGSRLAGTGSLEVNGFRNLISTTVPVGGIDPAVVNAWRAASVDLNGGVSRPLTLALLHAQQRKILQKGNEGANLVLSSFKQQERFYTLLQAQARFDGDMSLEAGNVTKAKYAGMRITGDLDCPNEDMFFVSKKHLLILAADKPYWQNKVTGGETLAWIQGTDSYGAKLTYRLDVGMNRRNAHARLGDLS